MCRVKLLELTLAIVKPHVVKQPVALREVRERILAHGFYVLQSRTQHLTRQQAGHFYREHQGKFFYNRLVTFMSSGPSEFLILAREDAISEWRRLMGPTKVYKAQFSDPQSLRGSYGLSDTRNATHGSDSVQAADNEMAMFFPTFDVARWYVQEERLFRLGHVRFLAQHFKHEINTTR